MSFLEPLFLIGLAAAALPVLVHLFNRRKAIRREFPAMAFLLESNKKVARSLKVRQWLLMALRILGVALLALALAKPYVFSTEGVTASERLPTAVVYVVDTSLSMGHDGWWDEAEERFDESMDRLRPWDEVALISTANRESWRARLGDDHGAIRESFDELAPTDRSTDPGEALVAAADVLTTTQLPNRRIVLITDRARGGFPMGTEPDEPIPYPVDVLSVRDEDDEHPANLVVTRVEYRQEGSSQESRWRIEASVRNTGPEPATDVEVHLLVDDELEAAGRIARIEPGRSERHVFRHTHDASGLQRAAVALGDGDRLPADDRRHFTFRSRDRVRALLVNGEPSSILYSDELFFLERALNPRQDSESNIIPTSITLDGLLSRDLESFDVVVLANVARLTPAAITKLETFVEGGGGLLVAMGDQVDVDNYNKNLDALLPKPLRGLKKLATRDDPDAPVKITRPGSLRHQHPIFRVFSATGGSSLQTASIYSYMLLEPSAPERSKTLLSYKDNAPALIERRVGHGRVLLLTTTLDFEWTDLPVRSAYLPLMRRSVLYLARRAASRGKERPVVGEKMRIEVSGMVQERVILHTPGEGRVVLEPEDGVVTFTPERAGLYTVFADSDEGDSDRNRLDDLAFAANIDVDESDLRALPDGALEPWLAPSTGEDARGEGAASGPRRRVNLWPTILFVITMVLLAETVIGTRRSVFRKLWNKLRGREASPLEEI
jgi:hypothetical protein